MSTRQRGVLGVLFFFLAPVLSIQNVCAQSDDPGHNDTTAAVAAESGQQISGDGGDDVRQEEGAGEAPAGESESLLRIPAGIIFGEFRKEDGPFLIEGSIIVPSGQTLKFGPGCTIYIGGEYSTITIFGQLKALGTRDEPIEFCSAKKKPNPWDWDRIYCRSRSRSSFRNCIVRHANYGIFVENGVAKIEECLFETNSLHACVVKNSEVTIRNSTLQNGHVCALYCLPGASVRAESLTVRDNITGVGCTNLSSLNMRGGTITRNTNGVAVREGALVDIIATDITRNNNGVVTFSPIPKKVQEMVYGNIVDTRLLSSEDDQHYFKEPERVKSIVLPKAKSEIKVDDTFKPGFSAMSVPREPTASFIGNVTVGFKYYDPLSRFHPEQRDTFLTFEDTTVRADLMPAELYQEEPEDTTIKKKKNPQNRYPGEQSDKFYAGLQPDVQVFMSGKRAGADVNMLMDVAGDQWVPFRKNIFNLSMNYSDQSLVLGDFFENSSETSIYGRQMTGLKYSGTFVEMGRGVDRLGFKLAAGESEVPKDTGDNEIDLYNEVVDSGMAVRQQLTYVAEISIKPTYYSKINVKGLIAKDQTYKPLFRDPITGSDITQPIQAQTGCIDGEITLLKGMLTLMGEIDMGTHDTLSDSTDVVWYNPEINSAIAKVFRSIPTARNYAVSLGARTLVKGFDIDTRVTQIGDNYFSAGNPYLQTDRRYLDLGVEKTIIENLSANAAYSYERSSRSNSFNVKAMTASPLDRNRLALEGKYSLGRNKPGFELSYTADFQNQQDVDYRTDTLVQRVLNDDGDTVITEEYSSVPEEYGYRKFKNVVGIEGKQRLKNGIDYSLKYQFLWDNDFTGYIDPEDMNKEDGTQHQVRGRFGFKIKRRVRNKISFKVAMKDEVRNSLKGLSYKVGDDVTVYIIPRKLRCTLRGEFNNRRDSEYDDDGNKRVATVIRFYGVEGEVKYSLTSKLSLSVMARYENSYDESYGSAENYSVTIGGIHVMYLF
jgi:hypothetical protein